jgi:hypothetical protein
MTFSSGSISVDIPKRIPHRDVLVLRVDKINLGRSLGVKRSHLATHVVSDPARPEVL